MSPRSKKPPSEARKERKMNARLVAPHVPRYLFRVERRTIPQIITLLNRDIRHVEGFLASVSKLMEARKSHWSEKEVSRLQALVSRYHTDKKRLEVERLKWMQKKMEEEKHKLFPHS